MKLLRFTPELFFGDRILNVSLAQESSIILETFSCFQQISLNPLDGAFIWFSFSMQIISFSVDGAGAVRYSA